ncbi:MAG: cache domain-containing protein [Candidatus Odinarchaeota archaeon]
MLEKVSIRTQILGSFAIFSILIIAVIASLSLGNLFIIAEDTNRLATDSLEDQVNRNMLLMSNEKTLVLEREFKTAESAIKAIAGSVSQLFSPEHAFGQVESYFDYNQSTLPPDTAADSKYQISISKTTSSYYFPGSDPLNIGGLITSNMNDTITRSAHLDPLLQTLYNDHGDFAWFNIAFKEGKLLRRFPGATVDPDRIYDPTTEPWYRSARDAAKGTLVHSELHYDPAIQNWVITLSQAIYDGDGNFIGVTAGDMWLDSIQKAVNGIKILKSGYGALIQKNSYVLAHPLWNPEMNEIKTIDSVELNTHDSMPALNTEHLIAILSSQAGIIRVLKNEEDYLLAHAPVVDEYVLLIIVPESEAIEVVHIIQQEIDNTKALLAVITGTLSILTLTVIITTGTALTYRITKPIDKLSKMAMQMTKNVTSRDLFEGIELDELLEKDDEIGDLTKAFTTMIDTLKKESTSKKG